MNCSSLSSVRVAPLTARARGIGGGLNPGRLGSSRTQGLVRRHVHLAAVDCPVPAEAVRPPSVAALIGSSKPCWPHLRLMRAILDDAVSIVVSGGVRASGTLRCETLNWFLADDTDWVFSFRNVCDALDLDADRIRARMAPWLIWRSPRR
jgi:hypothetical protein